MEIRTRTVLIAILIAGAVLRLAGVHFGLPFVYHNDENVIVNYALAYGAGDLNPHNFLLPPFPSYILFFCYGVLYFLGKLAGYFGNVNDFARLYLTDPTVFFLVGRIVLGVLPGVATIYYVYVLGKKCFSEHTGMVAAFLLSINFLHVLNSHYIYGDILLTLVAVVYLVALYGIYERGRVSDFFRAGLLLGIGVSVKYNAGILVLPTAVIVLYCLWKNKEYTVPGRFLSKMFIYGVSVILALFVTNPFMFLDFETFRYFLGRMPLFGTGWIYHLKVSIIGSIGLPLFIFTVIGIFLALIKRNVFMLAIVILIFSYYVTIVFSSQTASRYVLLIMPMIVLFGAYGIVKVAERFKGVTRYAVIVILIVISGAYTLVKTVYSDILFFKEDTRTSAYNWATANLARGERIAIDAAGPSFPQLRKTKDQLLNDLKGYTKQKFGKPDGSLDFKIKAIMNDPNYDRNAYEIYYLFPVPGKKSFLSTISQIPVDVGEIERLGIKYVFINRILALDKYKGFMTELSANAELVKEFSPYKKDRAGTVPKEYSKEPAAAFGLDELTARECYGPVLRVYKMKE